jgi:hypothetical protein
MDPLGDRSRNPKRPVDPSTRPWMAEHDDTGLVQEEAADEVVAHLPFLGELLD